MKMLNVQLALVILMAGSMTLQAEKPKQDGPCKADIEKFCKDVPRGGGKIKECMKQHKNELSPECKAASEKASSGRRHGFMKACKDDAKKLCPDASKTSGGVKDCLKAKATEASPACQAELKKVK